MSGSSTFRPSHVIRAKPLRAGGDPVYVMADELFSRASASSVAHDLVDTFEVPEPRARPADARKVQWPHESALKDPVIHPFPKTSWLVASGMGGRDPQIAVSSSHVIVTTSGRIAFYTKGGTLLKSMKASSFFSSLLPFINAAANLPSAVASKYPVDTVYDMRVLFDPFRSRFWMLGLCVNQATRDSKDVVGQTYRRTKFVLAVSDGEDPTKAAWSYWFWDAIVDDGACNKPSKPPGTVQCPGTLFHPGDGSDYPLIGISQEYFVVGVSTNKGGGHGALYANVTAIEANAMTAGIWKAHSFFNFTYPDGAVVQGTLCPVIHHGYHYFGQAGLTFLLSTRGQQVIVWAIQSGAPPSLVYSPVPVQPFAPGVLGLQAPVPGEVPHPSPVDIGTRLGPGQVMKAAYLQGPTGQPGAGTLYAVWHDCVKWLDPTAPLGETSIRLVRLDVSKYPAVVKVSIDRTFGLRSATDPPNTIFSYGWPAVDVTDDGHMVINYSRTGSTIHPEARYSIYRATDTDIEPSHLLHAGEYVVGANDPGSTVNNAGRLDNTGSATDPSGKAVWIVQPYAERTSGKNAGHMRLAVARVTP